MLLFSACTSQRVSPRASWWRNHGGSSSTTLSKHFIPPFLKIYISLDPPLTHREIRLHDWKFRRPYPYMMTSRCFAASGSVLPLTTSNLLRRQNDVSMHRNELAAASLSNTANAKDADGNATAVRQPPSKCKVPLHSKDGTIVDYAYVDEEGYVRVRQWRWWRTCRGYVAGSVNGIIVYLHRYIMKDKRNHMMIDHKNRNKLDNTKANLREATPFQNNMNMSKVVTSKTSSLYHGVAKVVLSSGKVKWCVFFRRRHIGWFHTEHEGTHGHYRGTRGPQ